MSPSTQGPRSQSGRGQGTALSERARVPMVVHPHTGEVLGAARELERFGSDELADVFAAIDERMAALREMRTLLDHEIVRRLDERGRSKLVVGDYELSLEPKRESVWDADELDYTLRSLVDQGVIEASEAVGVINTTPTVSRSNAQRLAARLAGKDRDAVEACRSWQMGRRTLRVVRSIPLISE
jgi:hypothetical protein